MWKGSESDGTRRPDLMEVSVYLCASLKQKRPAPWYVERLPSCAQGRTLDTNPALMIEERRRWHAWFAGDVDGRVAMHIQMWADKYPEGWADFIVEMWLSEECTRESKSAADEIRWLDA